MRNSARHYTPATRHIGRPVFATNDLGVKVWEASYLPFGGVHVATGGIDLRFPGQWFQAESGLHQNWMRDYDPTTGRYLQADPLGLVPGPGVYDYAYQNPMYWTDPTGECPWCILAAILVAGLVLDYMLDEGCYTLEDFGWSLASNVNTLGKAKVGYNLAKSLAKGGGKNATKRRADDIIKKINKKMSDAKRRLREAESKSNKTPEDKDVIKSIKREIKRLDAERRRSENHSMKPKG